MNVSLGDRWEAFVASKVEEGDYQSASEVLRAALRLLSEQDDERTARLSSLRGQIAEGLRAAREGRSQKFDESTVARVKNQGRRQAGLDD